MRKVQAATSNESAKCSFSSVHRELTGTAGNHVGPRGPTTRDSAGMGRTEERKEAEGALLTHNIHTKRQTKTNATCIHTVFHTLWVNTPLSGAQGIQRYSPQKYRAIEKHNTALTTIRFRES